VICFPNTTSGLSWNTERTVLSSLARKEVGLNALGTSAFLDHPL
jgi:hypothetical protein